MSEVSYATTNDGPHVLHPYMTDILYKDNVACRCTDKKATAVIFRHDETNTHHVTSLYTHFYMYLFNI